MQDINNVLKLNPNYVSAKYQRAMHNRVNGNIKLARDECMEILSLDEYHVGAHNELGIIEAGMMTKNPKNLHHWLFPWRQI